MIRKWLNSITLSVILTLVSLFLYGQDLTLFQLFELKSYDFKVRVRGERPISDRVVIVGIDEKSLGREGRWPWPRFLMARLVDRLVEAKVTVIGFDIFFPERETSVSPSRFEEGVRDKGIPRGNVDEVVQWYRTLNDSDRQFAAAIERSARAVMGYYVYTTEDFSGASASRINAEHLERLDFSQFSVVQRFDDRRRPLPLTQIFGVGMSLPELMRAANSGGFVSFVPQIDGVVRWVPTVMQHADLFFPSLSLQMLREAMRLPLALNLYGFGVDEMRLGERAIPVRENGDLLVNFFGPAYTFRFYSATDVLSGKVGRGDLEDKIVLVGGTAAGTHDLHITPFGPLYPGVEVHANVMESILQKDFIIRPQWLQILDVAMIVVSGLLLGLVSRCFQAYATAAVLGILVVGYLGVDFYLFSQKGLWVNSVYPVFTQLFVYTGLTLYRYAFEEREKRFIKSAFSQYLAPAVVNQMVKDPSILKLGGEEKELTAYFTDLSGFTTLSEKLTPEGLITLMNLYMTEMMDALIQHEGTLDKFEGDAIKAFFGAPVYFPDHARRACMTAIEMQKRLREKQKAWTGEDKQLIKMRIGVNTGRMVVGNMGSKEYKDYTMMGDSVNLTARLEGINKQYKTYTMISDATYRQATDVAEVRELDVIRVVGKREPVKIYELLGKKGEMDDRIREILPYYFAGYELYKKRDWNESARAFEKALTIYEEDGPSLVFLERCITFQIHPPPPDWDGVFTMGTK